MIKQLFESVFHIRAYPEFTRQKHGPFSYVLLLSALYYCIAIVIPVSAFLIRHGGYDGLICGICPDFVFEDGTLSVDEPLFLEVHDVYFDIDTERPFFLEDVRGALSEKDFAVLADAGKCYIRTHEGEQLIRFSDYAWINISRGMILSMKNEVYLAGAFVLTFLFLMLGIGIYFLMRILGLITLAVFHLVVDEPRPGYRGATILCARAATLPVIILAFEEWITASFLNGKFVLQVAQIVWIAYMVAAIYLIQKESEKIHEEYLREYRKRMAEDALINGERYEDRMYEDRMYDDLTKESKYE